MHQPRHQRQTSTFDVGFAFAGSTLLGHSIYALGSQLARAVYTHKTVGPHPLSAIAELFAFAYDAVMRDYNEKRVHHQSCEVSIFGYCPSTLAAEIYHIRAMYDGGNFNVQYGPLLPGRYLILGERAKFRDHIRTYMDRRISTSEPIIISEPFSSYINDPNNRNVGGSIQYCNVTGLEIRIDPTIEIRNGVGRQQLYGVDLKDITKTEDVYQVGDMARGALRQEFSPPKGL